MQTRKPVKNVDAYIKLFPKEVEEKLNTIRSLISKAAPDAAEGISYRIPAYTLNGILIYFAAFTEHVSLYPYTESMCLTKTELAKYQSGKGTLKFDLEKKLPVAFIRRILKIRIGEQRKKTKKK